MAIIDSADMDYSSRLSGIRYLVSSDYTSEELPDARIESSEFLGRFNIETAIDVPNYASLSSDNLSLLKSAVSLRSAAQILWTDSQIRREDVEGEEAEYQLADIDKRIEDYRSQATAIVRKVAPAAATTNVKAVFTVFNPKSRF